MLARIAHTEATHRFLRRAGSGQARCRVWKLFCNTIQSFPTIPKVPARPELVSYSDRIPIMSVQPYSSVRSPPPAFLHRKATCGREWASALDLQHPYTRRAVRNAVENRRAVKAGGTVAPGTPFRQCRRVPRCSPRGFPGAVSEVAVRVIDRAALLPMRRALGGWIGGRHGVGVSEPKQEPSPRAARGSRRPDAAVTEAICRAREQRRG